MAQAVLLGLWGALLLAMATGELAVERLGLFTAVGLVLGLVRAITGSVWATIGLHLAFQTVAQLLLNTERGHFAMEGAGTMQVVALGIVPFTLATMIVRYFYRDPVSWQEADGRATGPESAR